MIDAKQLFNERLNHHIRELSRYLRYIFNGHIAVALIFFLAAAAVFYQEWLAGLPDNFPASIVLGLVFGFIVTYNPIRTFLQKPDLMFLIVAEGKLHAYFRRGLRYSFFTHLYIVFLFAAIFGPLYFHVFDHRSGRAYLLTILVIIIVKAWNLMMNWWTMKMRERQFYRIHWFVRLLINISLLIYLIEGQILLATIATFMLISLFFYTYHFQKKFIGLPWQELVDHEERQLQSFYRLANLFTDVPQRKVPVKRRRVLTALVQRFVPMEKPYSFDYLYRLSFVRSGDYFGMYVRLLVIGSLAIYFVNMPWIKIGLLLLFIYMSSFQLLTLYRHHRTILWLDLYPVSAEARRQSFLRLIYELTFLQTAVFLLVFLWSTGDLIYFLMVLGISFLFAYSFINLYIKKQIKQT